MADGNAPEFSMADGKRWIKYVYDIDGNVVVREIAVAPEDDNGLTFFVRAKNFEIADKLAHRKYMLAVTKARHAQYDREGRCRCGRARDVKNEKGAMRKRCSVCLAADGEYKERARRRAAGEEVEPRPRLEVLEERRKEELAAFSEKVELETLETLDDIWSRRGVFGLRQHLKRRLDTLRRKAVAA